MSRDEILAELAKAHRERIDLEKRWAADMPGCSLSVHIVGLPLATAFNAVRRRCELLHDKLKPPKERT